MMDWIDRFPGLSKLDEPIRSTLIGRSQIVDLPAGTVIFVPGKAPESLLHRAGLDPAEAVLLQAEAKAASGQADGRARRRAFAEGRSAS